MRVSTVLGILSLVPFALFLGCGGSGGAGAPPAADPAPVEPSEVEQALERLAGTTTTILEAPPGGLPGYEDLLFVVRTEDGWEAGVFGRDAVLGGGLTDLRVLYRSPDGPPLLVTFGSSGLPDSLQIGGHLLRIQEITLDEAGVAHAVVQALSPEGASEPQVLEFDGEMVDLLLRLQASQGLMKDAPGVRPAAGKPGPRKPGDWKEGVTTALQAISFSLELVGCVAGVVALPNPATTALGAFLTGYGCGSQLVSWGKILRGEGKEVFTEPMTSDEFAEAVVLCAVGVVRLQDPECLLDLGLDVAAATLANLDEFLASFDGETITTDQLLSTVLPVELVGTWEGRWFNTIVNGTGGCTYENGGFTRITITSASLLPGLVVDLDGSTYLEGIDVRNTFTCEQLPSVSNTGAFSGLYGSGEIQGTLFSGAAAFLGRTDGTRMTGTLYRNGAPYGEFSVTRIP